MSDVAGTSPGSTVMPSSVRRTRMVSHLAVALLLILAWTLPAPLHSQEFAHIDQLFFSKVKGGADPLPQVLTITGTGSAFSFNAVATTSSGGDWLAVSSNENCCITPAQVSVIVTPNATLPVGSYSGQVVFRGSGNSLIVNVTLVIAPLDGAVFDGTPGQLSFSMKPGGQPSPQVIKIRSAGRGTLNWRLIGSSFNNASNFLSVSAHTGTAPTVVTLEVLPENLPNRGTMTGVYTGQLLFLAGGSAVTVPISVSVGDAEVAPPGGESNPWPANAVSCGGFGNKDTGYGATTIAPDGTHTGQLVYEANPASGPIPHYEYRYLGDLGVGQQTISFHFKASGSSWVYILSQVDGIDQRVWFNLAGNGTVGDNVPAGWTAQITPVGGGWYRSSVTFTAEQYAIKTGFGLAPGDQQVSDVATAGKGVYEWGQQFEHGLLTDYKANVGPCLTISKSTDVDSIGAGLTGRTIAAGKVGDVPPGQNGATYSVGASNATGLGTSSGTVTPISVTPSSGNGTQQTFNLVYTDSAGMSDLNTAWVWFDNSASSSVTNTCLAYSYPRANALYLLNDAGSAFLGPITVGSSNSLSNSQCTISGSGSSTSTAGKNPTVNLAVSFTAGFVGSKNTKMQVQGFSGQSGWVVMGTWTVPGTVTVAPVSVTPSSGSGTQQTFNLVYTDSAGMGDLNTAWVWFDNSASSSVANACLAYSYPRANALYLLNDAGSAFLGPITVGSSNSVEQQPVHDQRKREQHEHRGE